MKKFFAVIMMFSMLCVPCSAEDYSAVCGNGTFNGFVSSDVITWLGVPYAKPPVDNLRWKAPQEPEESAETFDADKFSAMPIQKVRETNPASLMAQDEDCLYLNVWKASGDSTALRPVMVWIHGGSFRSNGTAEPEWSGHNLAADNPDVMVVAVGYRLGLMGFIDFSEVEGGGDFKESGNLGILDVLQSLKWLNENIAAFGGDPENITVFGQSSGSALISLLMTMPEAQGLFQRAILQSGSVSMSMARKSETEDATQLAKLLLEATGAANMTDLMALTSTDLQIAATSLDGALNFPERDGVVLSEDVYTAFATNAANYDVLIGSDADEVRYFLGAVGSLDVFNTYIESAYNQIIEAIPDEASALLEAAESFMTLQEGKESVWAYSEFFNELLFRVPAIQMASTRTGTGRTYMYYWNIPTADPYLSCHGIELPYVFNNPSALVPDYALSTPEAQAVRTVVQQNIWVDFAVDGEITGMAEYDTANRTTIIMSADVPPVSQENDPLSAQRELITPLLAMNVSGREIINAVNAGTTPESNPESDPEDLPAPKYDLGDSSSGCNAGMLSMVFMLLLVPVIKR